MARRALGSAVCHAWSCRRARPSLPPHLLEVVGIDLDEVPPLGRDLVFGEDRVHRAGIDARAAIDALVGIDVVSRQPSPG